MDDVVNDGLRIRLRDGRDIADLLALFNEERFLRYASARGPFASAAELEAWLSAVTCAKRYETVAVLAGRTIGFAGLYVMGEGLEHSGWVLIGVREEFQARGVGARLLKTLDRRGDRRLRAAARSTDRVRRQRPGDQALPPLRFRDRGPPPGLCPPRRKLRRRLHHGEAQRRRRAEA